MKIDDIESKKLLPNWAHDADWIQAAFDQIVLMCTGRLPAINAPLTMQAIQCLTDEELREWYARFGVVDYYPELNRETREHMLFLLARLYRFLGTPSSVTSLCRYIFDEADIDIAVQDNLAFDESGTLIDSALLDLFDIVADVHTSQFTPDKQFRLFTNILRIVRNSQTLRKIIYDYASDIDVNCGACSYGGDVCIDYSDNDELARDVTPPVPAVIIGYTMPNKSAMNLSSTTGAFVYDDAGNMILYETGKTYTLLKFYYGEGDTQGTAISDITWTLFLEERVISGEHRLFLHAIIPNYGRQSIQRIEYTVL